MIDEEMFTIGEASRLTKCSIKQIRYWMSKGIINGCRISSGEMSYRFFSKADVEHIRAIRKFLDEGYTLEASAKKADEKFKTDGGNTDEEKNR